MRICFSPSSLLPVFFLIVLTAGIFKDVGFNRFAEGGQRRIHITDDLDDVVDDEEDESWKEWGKKKSASSDFDLPPPDLSKMELPEIQAEMMKRQSGPTMGFVKLRLGVRRTPEMVATIAMQWTRILKTGSIEAKFMAVDLSTLMFTVDRGQDLDELKEFVFSHPESYEIKIGEQAFRRPGDPPVEEVIEMLQKDKNKADDTNPSEDTEPLHQEL
ncbi:uncharacterized protein LOC111800579 [Cucurbita pepo subsp. pepo]|uniref:uncharacterized protein LOC111800579 n=1 Tax=Cucurbita pepo subsp. pepo TaxID=3664 RepID=UPI000C9D2D5A|nr:uncharacterized protein LOC111800579 [Cucurbita pepo subsp. pepo]